MVEINHVVIDGKWERGYALDVHTTSSVLVGHDAQGRAKFNNTYSALGTLVNRLKYQQDRSAAAEIIDTAVRFLWPRRGHLHVIVPVPPSTERPFQPVYVLAEGIGRALRIPVAQCVSTTRAPSRLKDIVAPELRAQAVDGLYTVVAALVSGKQVLLLDDVFRSGTTMNAVTDVLLGQGNAAKVYALAMTYTRTRR